MRKNPPRPLLVLCGVLLVVAGASEGADYGQLQAKQILLRIPGNAIRFGHNDSLAWVEYCPDNTCEVIRGPSHVQSSELSLFSASYLLHLSGYLYIEQWPEREAAARRLDQLLRERGAKSCASNQGCNLLKCVLKEMYSSNRFSILFLRFDERQANRVSVDFVAELERMSCVE